MTGNRIFILASVALLCPFSAVSAAEKAVSQPDEDVLGTLVKAHPRLMLTEKRMALIKRKVYSDEVLKRAMADVVNRADGILKKKPLEHKLTGPRLLSVSRDCLDRIYTLGVAYRFTGKAEYAKNAEEVLLTVCAFKDWNPSHFLDTAEMSHAVGVGYDWFYGSLSPQSRDAIRKGLIENGMKPGVASYKAGKQAWWVNTEYNWNQVCNSGLLIGALAIADENPEFAREFIPNVRKSLPRAIATYRPDGAWPEGPGYWGYATDYTVYGLSALETALGRDFGLSDDPGLAEAGYFPLMMTGTSGLHMNFADAKDNQKQKNTPILFWLGQHYKKPEFIKAEIDLLNVRGNHASAFDVMWYEPLPVGRIEPLPLDKLFRGPVELAVFRSAWDKPDALFAGIKAGFNRVNHGHLDLGSFVIDALGERWASDLGGDDYNLPGYWDSRKTSGKRWSYYRLGSMSHNICILDGRHQEVGGKSSIIQYRSTNDYACAVIDLTSAYQPKAGKSFRGLALVNHRRAVLVQDEFDIAEPCSIAWGMTTHASIKVEKNRAVLSLNGKEMKAVILSPAGLVFSSESGEQQPPQALNDGVSRLVIKADAVRGPFRIVVLLEPVWKDQKLPFQPRIVKLSDW